VRPFDYYLFTSRSLTPRARRRRCRRPSADAADAATAAAAAAAADAVHAVCVACNNIASASNEQQVVVNQTIGSGVPCFVFPHSRAASSTDHRPNERSATAMAGLSSPPFLQCCHDHQPFVTCDQTYSTIDEDLSLQFTDDAQPNAFSSCRRFPAIIKLPIYFFLSSASVAAAANSANASLYVA